MSMTVLPTILRVVWLAMWMRVVMHYLTVPMNMHMNNYFPNSITTLAILGTDLADASTFRTFIEFRVHR